MTKLIPPYGGTLQTLSISSREAEQLKAATENYLPITLSNRQLCDLEMLAQGAYSPLSGFMDQETYHNVVNNLTLPNGLAWPLPITLDIDDDTARQATPGVKLALQDSEGFMLAVMTVKEQWQPDKNQEAQHVYGTTDKNHPGVAHLYNNTGNIYVAGKLQVIQPPEHYVFSRFRRTPKEMRRFFDKQSWTKVLGYQTSTPLHRLHYEMLINSARELQAHILIQPTVGSTKPKDTHYFHRVKCYESVLDKFPLKIARMSLMPHSMRMAGPRETLLHAIIQQNYGCTHFLVGPHHASPNNHDATKPFYTQYAAQQFIQNYQDQLDIQMVAVEEHQYLPSAGKYQPVSQIKQSSEQGHTLSENALREKLYNNEPIPEWFSFPEVINELRKTYKPRSKQGITLFFTGLSGSGKSTIAKIVNAQLIEHGTRPVTLLDGDIVRLNLSSELGFSKAHRNLNIQRIGFVANEITKNGGIAICAPIAPYSQSRKKVRALIEQHGAFIEIHIATPLEVCEARDRKGLYAKARKGIIPEFTGISDPYETPEQAELTIDTTNLQPLEAAQKVILYLFQKGYLD